MKSIVKSAAFLFITVLFFVSCKKDKKEAPSEPSEPKAKSVKAKVIEYENDLPIEGATLSICSTELVLDSSSGNYRCPGNYRSLITDAKGECFFEAETKYFIREISKDSFLSLQHVNFQERCLMEGTQGYGQTTADSFLFRMVPYRYITLHVKNMNANLDFGVLLSRVFQFYSKSGDEMCRSGIQDGVLLRPGIDTVFQYLASGNAENIFTVSRGSDNDEGIFLPPIYYQQVKYIPKAGDITVEIIY